MPKKKPRTLRPQVAGRITRVRRPTAAIARAAPTRKVAKKKTAKVARRAERRKEKNIQRARRLLADIKKRSERIANDFHAIGRALRRLSEPALYGALGYDGFPALLRGEKLFSKTLAYKLMAVADAYPVGTARRLGVEKAYALLSYVEATPAADVARTLAETNPRIDGRRLESITVRELVDATRAVRAREGRASERSEAEKDARRAAKRVQRALRAKGASTVKARARRVAGEWAVQVTFAPSDAEVVAPG